MLVDQSRLPTWPRNCLQEPFFGPSCGLTWELTCFSKISKYDKPLLRRIIRGSTKSYPIHKFEHKNPVQRCRSIIHHFVHSTWHLDVSYVFADGSVIACSRARCTAAARKHNTTPPLRPRRGLTRLGWRRTAEA